MNIRKVLMALAAITATAVPSLAQHVTYRGTAHYNRKVAEFERKYSEIDSTKIVMLGNSLTEFGRDWSKRLGVDSGLVVNRGIMGDNTVGMRRRLCQITPRRPRAIFLMAGINDLTSRVTAEQLFQRICSVIDSIRSQSPATQVFVQSLLPINLAVKAWRPLRGQAHKIPVVNSLLADYCREQQLVYVDIYSSMTDGRANVLPRRLTADGLHVNEAGYAIWADVLRRYVPNDTIGSQPRQSICRPADDPIFQSEK